MKYFVLPVVAAMALAGCATKPSSIAPTYVSPIIYNGISCEQLSEEAQRVSQRAAAASGVQESQVTKDAVLIGVTAVLFWPAVFFVGGDSTTATEIAHLKGEMQAIEQASIRNNCGIKFASAAS